jgi:hypothetical protein
MNIQEEMQRPVAAATVPLNWFLLFAFFDNLKNNEEAVKLLFSSSQDYDHLMKIVEELHNKIFPPKKSNVEDVLVLPSKTLIV